MEKIVKLIMWGIFLLGVFFLIQSLHGATPRQQRIMKRLHDFRGIPKKDMSADWQQEYDFHKKEGLRCWSDAKEKCWWLPVVTDRNKARECFTVFISMLGGSTPSAKIVIGLTAAMLNYGLDAMDEWNYIENKLHWAEYHFELCDHYSALLSKKVK